MRIIRYCLCVLVLVFTSNVVKAEMSADFIYHSRMHEFVAIVHDISDYLLQDSVGIENKQVRAEELKSYFVNDAKVIVQGTYENDTISIDQFVVDLQASNPLRKVYLWIDSIAVPNPRKLNKNLADTLVADAEYVSVNNPNKAGSSCGQLPVVAQFPERGKEYVPVFGNMKVHLSIYEPKVLQALRTKLGNIDKAIYKARTTMVEEFIERFNCEQYNPMISSESDNPLRNNLLMLFNLNSFTKPEDISMVKDFVDVAASEGAHIGFCDGKWFAKAVCSGSYDGKPSEYTLYLKVAPRKASDGDIYYQWVICDAEGQMLNDYDKKSDTDYRINPAAHETNFMELAQIINAQPKNFAKCIEHEPSALERFTAMVESGHVKFDYVKKLDFVFTQVPGYEFTVGEFLNQTTNSGWLIYNLKLVE